jgi:hypothetical protein
VERRTDDKTQDELFDERVAEYDNPNYVDGDEGIPLNIQQREIQQRERDALLLED